MPRRLVLLGASNLLRGFATVLRAARARWGDPLEVLAALGHGRSYGMPSAILTRVLPGITECGLWRALEGRPASATRALLTDVGNDIMYGARPDQILAWVSACVGRLAAAEAEVVMTGLPLPRLERLSRAGYAALRALFFPVHRWIPLPEARARARELAAGVEELAAARGAVLVHSPLEWYGLDPIHVRPALWGHAWRTILFAPDDAAAAAPREPPPASPSALRLYLLRPERQRLMGRDMVHPQPALHLPGGGSVSLF